MSRTVEIPRTIFFCILQKHSRVTGRDKSVSFMHIQCIADFSFDYMVLMTDADVR